MEPEETIEWLGHGFAKQLPSRGMSDYLRENGNSEYQTDDGCKISIRKLKDKTEYKARTKRFSSKWKPSLEEAFSYLNQLESNNKNLIRKQLSDLATGDCFWLNGDKYILLNHDTSGSLSSGPGCKRYNDGKIICFYYIQSDYSPQEVEVNE